MMALTMLVACSGAKESNELSFETIEITENQLQPFLTFEEDSIAQPFDIEVLPNGNGVILDIKLKKLFIYNTDGIRQSMVGGEGRGPGEFVQPIALQHTHEHVYVYDQGQFLWQKYTFDGELAESVQNVGGGIMAGDVLVIADGEYLIPADGRQEALIQYKNSNVDSSLYFGSPMGDSTTVVNLQDNANQAKQGEIPDIFKNMISLAHSPDAYYAFLRSYGRLQKYNHVGELQWDKKLDFPFMQRIFQNFVETNKNRKNEATLRMLRYAKDMYAVGDHIYLLMSTPANDLQVLLKMDDTGAVVTRYNINVDDGSFNKFAVTDNEKEIYFINFSLAQIVSLNLSDVK